MTSVHGRNYGTHILGMNGRTLCKRYAQSDVNCVGPDEHDQASCKLCQRVLAARHDDSPPPPDGNPRMVARMQAIVAGRAPASVEPDLSSLDADFVRELLDGDDPRMEDLHDDSPQDEADV